MSTITQLLNNKFGGIRRKDSAFSEDKITCSDCQNVELFFTKLNSGIGLRTSKGNYAITKDRLNVVYSISNNTPTQLVTNATLVGNTLTFTYSGTTYTNLPYSEEDNKEISEVTYYAFKHVVETEGEEDTVTLFYTKGLTYPSEIRSSIPADEEVIEAFETNQDGSTITILYTENATVGKLYTYNKQSNTLTQIDCTPCIGTRTLTKTGKACGTDFTQGWLDMFIFSNGVNVVYMYSNTSTHGGLTVESSSNITLRDVDNRTVKGLGLFSLYNRLWIFDGRVLWYSKQAECRNFNYVDPSAITSAGYIEFVKDITAIYPYLGSLAVFHKDSSSLVKEDSTTIFSKSDESPGGCASYRSLVFHGTDLYFYDDTKKGVFSFQQVVNGDKTLGDNIALDIQDELMQIDNYDVDEIKALSVVTEDRNEVWFLVPISEDEDHSIVLIFDYIRGEWIKRKCQHINSINVVKNVLYSMGKDIYEEYIGTSFDDEWIKSFYTCSIFTYGSDNTLKITKFPPRLTVDGNYRCDFWTKYIRNYDSEKVKEKQIRTQQRADVAKYDMGYLYDRGYIYLPDTVNAVVKLPSATFKAIEIGFETRDESQQFSIKAFEISKLKIKQV